MNYIRIAFPFNFIILSVFTAAVTDKKFVFMCKANIDADRQSAVKVFIYVFEPIYKLY